MQVLCRSDDGKFVLIASNLLLLLANHAIGPHVPEGATTCTIGRDFGHPSNFRETARKMTIKRALRSRNPAYVRLPLSPDHHPGDILVGRIPATFHSADGADEVIRSSDRPIVDHWFISPPLDLGGIGVRLPLRKAPG